MSINYCRERTFAPTDCCALESYALGGCALNHSHIGFVNEMMGVVLKPKTRYNIVLGMRT